MNAQQMLGWYIENAGPNHACYAATVPLPELIDTFIQEGAKEGVRGDIAFAQSILETGWFCWPGGSVKPSDNNFAGLGATDVNPKANKFATAREGIRAQMQHLHRYADEGYKECSTQPCLDARFKLVTPGRAPLWNQFGNGVWASSKNNYAGRILDRFSSMLAFRDQHPS
jgi:hypothetical protein